jgi:UDP-N-acetyl-D-mannosaminuronate dehydrogenase
VPGIERNVIIDLIKSKHYLPSNQNQLIEDSEIIVIAVPTPLNVNRYPDLKYLEEDGKYGAKLRHPCIEQLFES